MSGEADARQMPGRCPAAKLASAGIAKRLQLQLHTRTHMIYDIHTHIRTHIPFRFCMRIQMQMQMQTTYTYACTIYTYIYHILMHTHKLIRIPYTLLHYMCMCMYMYVRVYLYRCTNSYFGLCVSSAGSDILASFFRSMLIRFTGSSRLAIPLFQGSGNYVSSPAGVGVWVVPGGRGWTPTFAIALFAAPAGVGAWVVPGGRRWTPNSCDMSIHA